MDFVKTIKSAGEVAHERNIVIRLPSATAHEKGYVDTGYVYLDNTTSPRVMVNGCVSVKCFGNVSVGDTLYRCVDEEHDGWVSRNVSSVLVGVALCENFDNLVVVGLSFGKDDSDDWSKLDTFTYDAGTYIANSEAVFRTYTYRTSATIGCIDNVYGGVVTACEADGSQFKITTMVKGTALINWDGTYDATHDTTPLVFSEDNSGYSAKGHLTKSGSMYKLGNALSVSQAYGKAWVWINNEEGASSAYNVDWTIIEASRSVGTVVESEENIYRSYTVSSAIPVGTVYNAGKGIVTNCASTGSDYYITVLVKGAVCVSYTGLYFDQNANVYADASVTYSTVNLQPFGMHKPYLVGKTLNIFTTTTTAWIYIDADDQYGNDMQTAALNVSNTEMAYVPSDDTVIFYDYPTPSGCTPVVQGVVGKMRCVVLQINSSTSVDLMHAGICRLKIPTAIVSKVTRGTELFVDAHNDNRCSEYVYTKSYCDFAMRVGTAVSNPRLINSVCWVWVKLDWGEKDKTYVTDPMDATNFTLGTVFPLYPSLVVTESITTRSAGDVSYAYRSVMGLLTGEQYSGQLGRVMEGIVCVKCSNSTSVGNVLTVTNNTSQNYVTSSGTGYPVGVSLSDTSAAGKIWMLIKFDA